MTTMTISKELLDELLSGVENADDLLGDKGLMKQLKVRLMGLGESFAGCGKLVSDFVQRQIVGRDTA
jgi:hypothetical protein